MYWPTTGAEETQGLGWGYQFEGEGEGEGWVEGGAAESPTETLDPVSEAETPVNEGLQQGCQYQHHRVEVREGEMVGPGTFLGEVAEEEEEGDEVFRKMVSDFRRAGFDV